MTLFNANENLSSPKVFIVVTYLLNAPDHLNLTCLVQIRYVPCQNLAILYSGRPSILFFRIISERRNCILLDLLLLFGEAAFNFPIPCQESAFSGSSLPVDDPKQGWSHSVGFLANTPQVRAHSPVCTAFELRS